MIFSSLIFIFAFLPVVWVIFHLLKGAKFRGNYTVAKLFLILASLFFYAYFKLEYLPILLGSIVVNFALAKLILNANSSDKKLVCVAENGGGGGGTPPLFLVATHR